MPHGIRVNMIVRGVIDIPMDEASYVTGAILVVDGGLAAV
jgi:NAD(P)-dependent dehydrogenase (short-subunit alcohol dehydrogenase family)